MPFIDHAAARILKTLLSVFFMRTTWLQGPQFSHQQMVHSARRFAQQRDDARADDERVNEAALLAAEGLLFGFYQNRPANTRWTTLVHENKTARMVRDAYQLAALLIEQTDSAQGQDAPAP
ncbi:MAG: hypothetical protein EOM21_21410 [Gammaproteobacteria bacterium]|nr:hypothetical protein [Gammaproteobacteria bacterium]